MEAYFVFDKDPDGGTLEVWREMPVVSDQRLTIQEVRKGEFDAETWMKIFLAEIKPDPTTHYDDVIRPAWDQATVIWTRKGGNVNGSDTV